MGIAPSLAVIFVSQLYDGSISDKEIVNRSGFLKKELWSDGDSVMADRGFTIHDELTRVDYTFFFISNQKFKRSPQETLIC